MAEFDPTVSGVADPGHYFSAVGDPQRPFSLPEETTPEVAAAYLDHLQGVNNERGEGFAWPAARVLTAAERVLSSEG